MSWARVILLSAWLLVHHHTAGIHGGHTDIVIRKGKPIRIVVLLLFHLISWFSLGWVCITGLTLVLRVEGYLLALAIGWGEATQISCIVHQIIFILASTIIPSQTTGYFPPDLPKEAETLLLLCILFIEVMLWFALPDPTLVYALSSAGTLPLDGENFALLLDD